MAHGTTAPLRRGTEATWQEAHGARQMAGRPRGHVGARVGRHVSRSREEILGQLIGESSPLFNRVLPLYFFRMGLCPTRFLPCRTRGGTMGVGSSWVSSRGVDRVDQSPRDCQIKHVPKIYLKWNDRRAYLSPRGRVVSVRSSS